MTATSTTPVGFFRPPPMRPIDFTGRSRNSARRSTHWSTSEDPEPNRLWRCRSRCRGSVLANQEAPPQSVAQSDDVTAASAHGEGSSSSAGGRRTPRTRPRRSASRAIPSRCARPMRCTVERNAHRSQCGAPCSSRKTLLPSPRGCFYNGSAIRLPNPPWSNVSWFGKNRSYESKPMSGLRSKHQHPVSASGPANDPRRA
jgi:hypothetical protein